MEITIGEGLDAAIAAKKEEVQTSISIAFQEIIKDPTTFLAPLKKDTKFLHGGDAYATVELKSNKKNPSLIDRVLKLNLPDIHIEDNNSSDKHKVITNNPDYKEFIEKMKGLKLAVEIQSTNNAEEVGLIQKVRTITSGFVAAAAGCGASAYFIPLQPATLLLGFGSACFLAAAVVGEVQSDIPSSDSGPASIVLKISKMPEPKVS